MKIGLFLISGDIESTGTVLTYRELRKYALTAEECGLDSIWLPDHLLLQLPGRARAGIWEVWTVLSGLAESTTRIELGTLVVCTAFRNPAVLAKMAVTLDAGSNRRLILGLGAGWHKPGFDTFGSPFDHRAGQFEEALEIIVPLVREGKVDFTETYVSAPECELLPGPARAIPILIAATKPRMLRLTAKYADSWNTNWLGDVSALAPARAALDAASVETGRDPSTLEVTVGINVAFPDLAEHLASALDPSEFLKGSVEEIAAGLRGYAEAGVGHVMAWLHPFSDESVRRFAAAASLARSQLGA